ncbi:MAG: bifunctional diaminohydroxyphosphoribosylaminopyrimidine deaminase/5-amino-6-(5-phosphoribosylamino)uracil reductase RibD [Coriobacteriales bacterium]|jgi:diaminohydroxyphosphoribosylaminopyrimidine deaminase/5-amino-6-(5-phosphoribosylamino)uracil reductase|nr:bifunctional diaminohydroxyphosphoribosylaminopyrimidine deaminase/5-amino-6-(5-phosphoribosylamino)uracil reductase RibD [Coriobacteriales bacterium]
MYGCAAFERLVLCLSCREAISYVKVCPELRFERNEGDRAMTSFSNTDILSDDVRFMQRAIELAKQGGGWVNPNPQVGAVFVKDGQIIGEGYHECFGKPHAERNAIKNAQQRILERSAGEGASSSTDEATNSATLLAGSTLYVTLEPCCYHGKTPACTEALIEHGISKVVIGSVDPNPQVAGKGIRLLKDAGIEVVSGFLQAECDELNQIFFHYIKTKTPYVLLKYAMTLDGKIATHTGASKWITGEAARAEVHQLRGRYGGIMVGIGTVLADNPLLNGRLNGGHNPLRIVCDTHLRIPLDSQLVQTATKYPTLIATACTDIEKTAQLEACGCEVVVVGGGSGSIEDIGSASSNGANKMSAKTSESTTTGSPKKSVDLVALMQLLGKRDIDSVLIEGGATLNAAALEAGIVNKVRCYIAPKLFGGLGAPSPLSGRGVDVPEKAMQLSNTSVIKIGDDYCIEGEVAAQSTRTANSFDTNFNTKREEG